MKRFVLSVAVLSLLFGGGTVRADEFLFGFSGDTAATLFLEVDGFGTQSLSTNVGSGDGFRQGWWSTEFSNTNDNSNYIVGSLGTSLFNDFFVFDIRAFAGATVSSATLRLQRESGVSESGATSHTYSLFDVSTGIATLLDKSENPDVGIYTDLGSGSNYGIYSVTVAGNPDEFLDFALNAAALADLNAALSREASDFAIGGTLTPGVAAVPEPGTLTLAGLGIVSFVGYGWRRRRAGAAAA